MESLNVKNINDEKIFNVIDPNGQGEVVNRIRPISISINQKAETMNDQTNSTINLAVYWNDTWKSILDLTFDESLRQEYGKLTEDLTKIQKDIDMKQYKDAETKTNDFLKYVANLSSKYTAIPEKAVVAKTKNDFIKITADKNSVKVAISDKLLNFMLKKYAKVDNLDYTKSDECFSTNKFSCLANHYDIYYHSPEIFKKQAYMTVVKDNKVVGSYKVNYDQFSKFAAKFMLTPQKLGYSKDRLAGYMKTAEVVMQNIFFDSVDEAKEWQEMVDEKKKMEAEEPAGEETTEIKETETKTKTEIGEGKSESPAKEEGGLARTDEGFASDEIPESEPRQQDQQGGGQNLGASRRLNLLKKKASYTDKEISNIGYEQGAKDGVKAKGIKETQETINKNLNQLKEKYGKDKNGMGSFILKEWNSFVAGYTNGFSDGLTGNVEKKAKVGWNAKPENEEEEIAVKIGDEIMEADFTCGEEIQEITTDNRLNPDNKEKNAAKLAELEEKRKKAVEDVVKKYIEEFKNEEIAQLVYEHLEDNNFHTANSIVEDFVDNNIVASKNKNVKKVAGKRLWVEVIYGKGKDDYWVTDMNPNVTDEEVRKYFTGHSFNIDHGFDEKGQPIEKFVRPYEVIIHREDDKQASKKARLHKKAGTGNFKTYDNYPLIAIGDDDVYSHERFVEDWNFNNTEEEPIKDWKEKEDTYYIWLDDEYRMFIEEMKRAIDSKDIPYHKIGIEDGYYEGLQLTVEEDSGAFFDDYDNEHEDEYSEYFESHNYAELPKEYEDARLDAWNKECDRVAQIMRDLGKDQGWGEYTVAYRFSNGETGYSRVKASRKAKRLNKKAIYGDVQEQDIVPAKTETKVYLQSEKVEDFVWLINSSGRIEILAPKALVMGATGSGDNSEGVEELRDYIKKDLEKISVEEMQKTVSEYGVDNVKEMDKDELERYLVWLLAGDTADNLENRLADEEDLENIKANTNSNVQKKAEEKTVEEKIEEQVADDTDDTVKGKIGVGDIVALNFDNVISSEDFPKYEEFIGKPLILMENDKEDITKVIVEQTEYPFQRITVDAKDVIMYEGIKNEEVIVEDTDGDEIITTFEELPVVAKQCKIKSIHKAARINKKKAMITKMEDRQFEFDNLNLLIDGKEEKCEGIIGIDIDVDLVSGVLPDGETSTDEDFYEIKKIKLMWLPELFITDNPIEFTDEEKEKIFNENKKRFEEYFNEEYVSILINEPGDEPW